MLRELAIKNFAIIDDIRISFSRGLSVLTGETGAGKSIIIEAVNLLLGGRASADLVRTGEKSAELEAFFEIPPESGAAKIMKSREMAPEEGLIIRRIIALNGRHRIFINSSQSTIQLLKQVTENLASISSQHAHQGLLKEDNHLDILDRFAGTWPLRNEVNQMYHELIPLGKEIARIKENMEKLSEENDFLKFQINEIESAKIQIDEDIKLEAERNRLKKGTEIFETMQAAMDVIYTKEESVLERLGSIRAGFEKHSEVDGGLIPIVEKLSRTMFELEDLNEELRGMAERIDLSPEILEETEARLDDIQKLKRKYGSGTLSDLFAFYENLKDKISSTENMAQKIKVMEKKAAKLSTKLGAKALFLSSKRKSAAKELSRLAENELKELDMGDTLFQIDLKHIPVPIQTLKDTNQPDFQPDPASINGLRIFATGIDKVSFLMAPNPGEAPKPLIRIASGGELSRVVLALKAILSETESLGTLVFDEVDAGIGGRTADKVGRKISRLAETYQVLCITHLAQIAKYGTTHFKIEKQVKNRRTATSITPLISQKDRTREIARMMGGDTITEATLAHASELLENG